MVVSLDWESSSNVLTHENPIHSALDATTMVACWLVGHHRLNRCVLGLVHNRQMTFMQMKYEQNKKDN